MPITEIDYSRISFVEALDYLSEKTSIDTDSYIEGQGIVQDVAFTVAAAKGQLLQDIRDAMDRSVANGESVDKFLKKFDNIAASYTNDWPLKGGNSWRGALIYQQNIRQAYNAGRYAQMTDPDVMKLRPYWQWRHGDSDAPRLTHLALDRKVFPADSLPFHPPMGFNCSCSVFSLSQRDVDKRGLEVEDLEIGQDLEVVDPSNGQTKTVQLKPDKGFDGIPGKSTALRRQEVLDLLTAKMAPDLAEQVRSEADPVRLNVGRLDERRRSIVSAAGEELVRKAEKAVQKALADTNVYIKITPDALESVVRDGRFKTAFELIEKDLSEVEIRRKAEMLLYGYPENLPINKRPVSGFLASDDDIQDAPLLQDPNAYGSIRVRLKRSIKSKASFTLNDSLTSPTLEQRGSETSWQPSALLDLNVASLVSLTDDTPGSKKQRVEQFSKVKTIEDVTVLKEQAYKYNFYMEIGLHGGVSANQIEAIIYTEAKPSQVVLEWAKINNIEVKK